MDRAQAVATWLEIRRKLRKRVPRAEWFLWVHPCRLLYVSGARPSMLGCALPTLILALPRSGRAIYKAQGRRDLVDKIAIDLGVFVFFTVAPDEYEKEIILQRHSMQLNFLDPDPMEADA